MTCPFLEYVGNGLALMAVLGLIYFALYVFAS